MNLFCNPDKLSMIKLVCHVLCIQTGVCQPSGNIHTCLIPHDAILSESIFRNLKDSLPISHFID